MGRVVLKTAPDRDQYVIWSSVVHHIVAGPGTRTQVAEHLLTKERVRYTPAEVDAILARTDEHGSSDRIMRFGWWDGDPLDTGPGDGGWYHLPRARLADYADALGRDDEQAARALLVCWHRFDDENEES